MDLLDHPAISSRYFFPRRTEVADPFWVSVPGADLACARYAPHPDGVTVVHFHGNGEVVADWADDLAPALEQAGLNLLLAEYRGYGASTGAPALATMLADAVAVFDAAALAPERTIAYGRSVGSIYALHLAAERQVGGLVIESGISDVLARVLLRVEPREVGATGPELRDAARQVVDHEAKMKAYGGGVAVLHALGDDLVPPSNARDLAQWAGDRAELTLYDRGDHNSIWAYNGQAIIERVVDLASRL